MFYIRDEVRKNSTLCKNKFVCISKEGAELCKVVSSMNDGKLFIFCAVNIKCVYKHEANGRYVCTCPVRNEIFAQYNI